MNITYCMASSSTLVRTVVDETNGGRSDRHVPTSARLAGGAPAGGLGVRKRRAGAPGRGEAAERGPGRGSGRLQRQDRHVVPDVRVVGEHDLQNVVAQPVGVGV